MSIHFTILFFAIVVVVGIILTLKYYRDKKDLSREFFAQTVSSIISGIVIGLIVGLVSFYSMYSLWQIQDKEKSEEIKNSAKYHQDFLTALLTTELVLNYKRMQELDKNVLIEQGFILTKTTERPTILSFPRPSFEAWNTVRYDKSNYLNNIDPTLQIALIELYFSLEEVENKVNTRNELILAQTTDKKDLELFRQLGSNIHVSLYSAKPKILEVAEHILSNQNIEENYGKLLWNERLKQ